MPCTDGPRRRTLACTVAAAIVLFVAPTAARAACAGADASPGRASTAELAAATVCLLNEQRTAAGLAPLASSAPLSTTASKYASYMVSAQHFAHQDEDGHNVVYRVLKTDPALANRWLVFGENLGWGSYSLATPRSLVSGWMNSPEHRANILYPRYNEIGVGIAAGAPQAGVADALTYTTVFAEIVPARPHTKVHRAGKKHHHRHRRSRG